jgi:hypothetical protein
VGGLRQTGLFALLAFACLPGLLEAQAEQTFVFRIAAGASPSRIEFQVAGETLTPLETKRFGPWKITVAFDPATCTISCVYRRTGRVTEPLLPPVTRILVFSGSAQRPRVVDLDPGGLKYPAVSAARVSSCGVECFHERSHHIALLWTRGDSACEHATAIRLPGPRIVSTIHTPLRI